MANHRQNPVDDLEMEGERPELTPPGSFPQVEVGGYREDRDLVREAQDREAAYNERMTRAKKKHVRELNRNPFIADGPMGSVLEVPQDDPQWAYKWVRHALPADAQNQAGVDTSNMVKHTAGRLMYEPVRLSDLPTEWQGRYRALVRQLPSVQGVASDTGYVVSRDLLLMRTSKEMRDLQVEAWDYQAAQLRNATKRQSAAAMNAQGAPVQYTDKEWQEEE